jgi:hypothetical protein
MSEFGEALGFETGCAFSNNTLELVNTKLVVTVYILDNSGKIFFSSLGILSYYM